MCHSVAKLLELPTLCSARQGINAAKLAKGDGKKKRQHKLEEDGDMLTGGLQPGAQVSASDSDTKSVFRSLSNLYVTHHTCQGHRR